MNEKRVERQEYFEANAGRFNFVIDHIGDLVLSDDSIIITLDRMDGDAEIALGAYTADDFSLSQSSKINDNPEASAYSANQLATVKAEFRFNEMQASATMLYVFELFDQKKSEGWDDESITAYANEIVPGFLNFVRGESRVLSRALPDGRLLELTKTFLLGVENYGEVYRYDVLISDEETEKRLSITEIAGQLSIAHIDLNTIKQPIIERGIGIMGIDFHNRLSSALTGNFKDEQELDEILGSIYIEYQGTSHEEEIGPFLDEVRNQAMSRKEFISLSGNLNIPNQDDLDEFRDILELK